MNDDEFNGIVDKIQNEIFEETKNALGEKGFERWRNPKFCGSMEGADGFARVKGTCGDTMEMYLKFKADKIENASYCTDGCGSSSVAASFTVESAIGKTVEQVFEIGGEDILEKIGTFPEEESHCAHLAVATLQEAVHNYMVSWAKSSSEDSNY